jgi:PAS domain S-box-containing protein
MEVTKKTALVKKHSFLSGGGEMGALTRQKDWSSTAVGDIDTWPQSLCTTLSIILNSKFPMFLFWGPQQVCFYNDAYRPSLGINGKHPNILGMAGKDAWPDIWHIIKPLIDQVMDGGEATWSEDQLIPIYRNGKMEDVYWTFSYSPVNDGRGKAEAVFVTCSETTDKVVGIKQIEISRQQFKNTVKQAPAGIALLKGPDFIVEMVNDAYMEFIDKKENDFVGKPLFESLPEVKNIIHPLLTGVLHTGVAYHANELRVILNRYGKAEPAYFNLVYQPFVEGDIISGVMVVATEVTASVTAKHALAESERQFRDVVMSSPIPMTIFRGPEHIIEMANDVMFKNIWRKEEKDVIGKKALEVFPELNDQKYPQLLKEVLRTGKSYSEKESVVFIQGDDGLKKFYLDYEYGPLKKDDGSISGVMITVNDVTGKVVAREKILKSEEKLRLAIDAASLGTFEIDLASDQIEYSERYLEIYGFSATETPSRQQVIEKLHPEDQLTRAYIFAKALQSGELEYEARVINKGEPEKWIRVRGKIIYDNEKKPVSILGTVADITKEKNIIRLIEENELRLRLATEGTNLATWDLDLKTNDFVYSGRLAEIFGHERGTIQTHAAYRAQFHPDDIHHIVENAFETALHTGMYAYEARIIKPDKTICWVKTEGYVIFDNKRVPLRMIGTMADITESKNNEEKSAKLAAIVQSSEDAIISKRTDGIITSWNDAAERLFGYTESEMLGASILKLIPGDRVHEEEEIISRLKSGERVTNFETKRLRKDKTIIEISLTVSPIKDSQGNIIAASKIARDITAQKRIERLISENERRLKIAVEAAEMGTWELDMATGAIVYSDRYLEILGFNAYAKPSHAAIMQCIHPDDMEHRNKKINEALQTGFLDLEMRIIAAGSKALKWVKSRGSVVYDAQRKPIKMLGTSMDVTEEKNRSEVLRISEEKFRLLANSMPQLVWTSDPQGKLDYFNQSVYDYAGLAKDEMDKGGWLQIVHPDDREENMAAWMHAVNTGEDFLFEHRFLKNNGTYRWQLSRAIPQKDENGKIQMWVGTSTDIHEIKENEQQKDLFISMASHELKTPITSIKGYIQIMQSIYNSGEDNFLKNSLNIVNRQINTLTNLISELLDLSKIKSGSLQLNKEQFNMNAMLQEIVNNVQHSEPGYTIVFTPGTDCILFADKERIGQVLINFLTNAIKYSPENKTVVVKSEVVDGYAVVSVEDKGIGINKADQEKIFQRFYRVEGKDEKTFPGFGIGLFIAAEIIERHAGHIEVISEQGKGSVFSFSLPLENKN